MHGLLIRHNCRCARAAIAGSIEGQRRKRFVDIVSPNFGPGQPRVTVHDLFIVALLGAVIQKPTGPSAPASVVWLLYLVPVVALGWKADAFQGIIPCLLQSSPWSFQLAADSSLGCHDSFNDSSHEALYDDRNRSILVLRSEYAPRLSARLAAGFRDFLLSPYFSFGASQHLINQDALTSFKKS